MQILPREECRMRLNHGKAAQPQQIYFLWPKTRMESRTEFALFFWNSEMGSIIPKLSSTSKICRCNQHFNVCGFTSAAVLFWVFFFSLTFETSQKMQKRWGKQTSVEARQDKRPQKVINKVHSYLAPIMALLPSGRPAKLVVVILQQLLQQAGWQHHDSLICLLL